MIDNIENTDFGEEVELKPLSVHPEERVTLDTMQWWYHWANRATIRDKDKEHFEQLARLALLYPEGTVFEIYSSAPPKET